MDIKKILIINLTRMGDILQTIPMLRALKRKYSNAEVDFLVMSSFSSILRFFPEINNVIELEDKILVTEISTNPWKAYLELQNKIDMINKENYDLIINPIASVQSSIIGLLINCPRKKGIFINNKKEQVINAGWSAFHLSNEHNLGDHSFNLANIFAGVADVRVSYEDFHFSECAAEKNLTDHLLQHTADQFIIGFHIGASRSNKTWETEKFIQVILNLLRNTNFKIVLFGGYNEICLKPWFEKIKHDNFVNLIGKSNLKELVSLITKVDLFVTNDTGPMHIAAALRVPIINLSLGPVSLWETAPFSHDALIIQADLECHPCRFDHYCSHLNCHHTITPEIVTEIIINKAEHKTINKLYPDIRLWKSTQDPFSSQHYVPLSKRPISYREFLFEAKRCVWGISLHSDLDSNVNWISNYMSYLEKYYFLSHFDFTELINTLSYMIKENQNLIKFYMAIKKTKPSDKKSIDRIKSLYADSNDVKDQIFRMSVQHREIHDYLLFTRFRESSLENDELTNLIKKTEHLYAEYGVQLQLLKQILEAFNE